jgi:hypothetical protein
LSERPGGVSLEFGFRIVAPQVIITVLSPSGLVIGVSIFRFKAELACPRCSSSNIDKKYKHMGEFACRHCHYFWKLE